MNRAPLVARAVATGVALVAVVDPVVRVRQVGRPTVAVVAASSRDSALAARVAAVLGTVAIVRARLDADADGVVVAGDRLAAGVVNAGRPTIAVRPSRSRVARIRVVRAPGDSPPGGSTPVTVAIERDSTAPAPLEVAVVAWGAELAHASVPAGPPATRIVTIALTTPDSTLLPLRIEVRSGASVVASADVAIGGARQPWRVLFAAARPSWGARFVRRTLAGDPRFEVASSVTTSRGVAVTELGPSVPPTRIGDAASLAGFDAVVIGAPDAVPANEAAALTRFARERGGSVIVLLDTAAPTPFDGALGVRGWTTRRSLATEVIRIGLARGPGPILGGEFAVPSSMPPAVAVLAARKGEPVVWSVPVGAGQFVVSGALDAWRFRDSTASAFAHAWPEWIANAASRAVPVAAIDVVSAAEPGEAVVARVSRRDAGRDSIRLSLEGTDASRQGIGATFAAPATVGVYRVGAEVGGMTVHAPLVVDAGVAPAVALGPEALSAWARGSGGSVVDEADLGQVPAALIAAVQPPVYLVPVHPMRSPWWIVPFALLLSYEWWARRCRGER